MKLRRTLFILPLIIAMASCSNSGDSTGGDTSESKILHGHGAPANSLGNDFNHYYDEDSRLVYEKKDGKWINQLTIGSKYLYENKSQRRILRSDDRIDLQELKDALMMSFYSTNATCFMNGYLDGNTPDSGSYANTKLDGRNIEILDREGGHYNYCKIDDNGVPYIYTDGDYVKNEFMAVELPHPTYDNLSYELMLIYDEELGEQTSIVCGNLDKATYDSETGYYLVNNISIHHNARTTLYFTEPIEDNMTVNFKFKLSNDRSYVSYAELKVVHSENKSFFDNLITSYEFSDMHSTSFEMPE